jgi:hypothetical protein
MGQPSSAPGWYPDPSGAGGQRYFDGTQWTDNRTAAHKAASKAWIWAVVAAVVVVAIGFSVLTSMSSKVAQENAGDGHTPGTGGSPSLLPGQVAPTAHLNDPVRDGKFQFVVTGVSNQRGYFVVYMNVRNIGDQAQAFFAQNQKLIDSSGRTYDADATAVYDFNQSGMVDLNPGLTASATVPFQVPNGEQFTFVEVHDSAFSGGVKVSLAR